MEISVEQKYSRITAGIDRVIESVLEVSGAYRINRVNIRRVRWTSFQPNFFVQMQPGVLEKAPQNIHWNHCSNVGRRKSLIQDSLYKNFHNINHRCRKNRTKSFAGNWTNDLGFASHGVAFNTRWPCHPADNKLEKHRQEKKRPTFRRFLVHPFPIYEIWFDLNSSVGILFCNSRSIPSSAASFLLSHFIFDRVWSFHWQLPVTMIIGVTLLACVTAELSIRKVLRENPSIYYKETNLTEESFL